MTVILVAHILVSIVLIIVVLMQRSEGGALGIGGGGGGAGGLMTGRGVAGALVRTTIIFGAIFFVTSLGLTTIASKTNNDGVTEIEQDLIDEFGGDAVDDTLGIDVIEDAGTIDLGDDPLAVTPGTPAPATDTPAEDESDPALAADPLADPQ